MWNRIWDWVFPEYTDFSPLILYEWTDVDTKLIVDAARAGKFIFANDLEPRPWASIVFGYDAWGNPMVDRVRGEFSL